MSWLTRINIGQKITVGYVLALSVAVTGSIVGFKVGKQKQQEAAVKEEYARDKVELLHRLQSRVLQTRTHQQQLIPLTLDVSRFDDEYNHITQHTAELESLWIELYSFIETFPNLGEQTAWFNHGISQ